MTEQEAEVLAKRLERVWTLGDESQRSGWEVEDGQNFTFFMGLGSSVHLRIVEVYGGLHVILRGSKCYLSACFDNETVGSSSLNREDQDQFTAHWMPFFRRGCWLSGVAIEASAHEKAEWIQGFTKEEIESWNLKM